MMGALGLDAEKQKVLFRTRARLTIRQFTREKGRLVGAFIAALFFIPFTLAAAAGTTFAYWRAPDPWPAQILGLVLVALWGLWMIIPIFAFRLNDGLDLEHLLVYPLSRRDLIASVLLGTLLDYPTYFTLPLFVAVIIGWGLTPALPIVLIAVILSYAQMILTSRLVVTAAGGILRSRRFRDVSIILASLIGSSCYFIQTGLGKLGERYVTPEQVLTLRPLDLLQWLPPGAAARAIEQATDGAWIASAGWLLYSALLLVAITWAWYKLVDRLATGGGFLLDTRFREPKEPSRPRRRQRQTPALFRWIPGDIRQIAIKELKAAWRIPQRRVGILQGLLLPLFFGGFTLFSSGIPDELPNWIGLTLPMYALFLFWISSQNMLGWEGNGLPTLLLTPVPRHRVFLGKGIALITLSSVALVPIGIATLWIEPGWVSVVGLLSAFAVGGVALGVSAVASVFFSYRVNMDETTGRLSTGGDLKTGLANFLLVPAVMMIAAMPLALVVLGSYWFQIVWLGYVGAFAGLLYGAAAFAAGSWLAGRLLVPREADVIQATREET